ncbi:di-trans,poly-cis-decaprenylcistransferase [Exophiala xenobiotica]|uniref:Di-trans,poly-cis-decaprenylcistransferase n=1 Tax=Exophiala xenobiotica TaxID=348802 RepID=A0A0D2EWC8_9EURO|nr:di-trans,poly-cis-decaprenylcistransferase [Exophiala xenobiotica]KIW59075.1 di-trans,poly-cis-decaprenylcistransferase [Exophiala xenobiotica]
MTSRHMSHVRRWLLSSPPAEWALNQLRSVLIGALRQGPMPKHVAFVMDGNRRYAKTHRIETVEGHNLGFEALAKILEVCYKSGVTHVTIYAFSIENFKRTKYEVDALMDMAKIKLKQLVQHGELLDRYGARIRILGQRELIKPDVLEVVDRAVEMTSRNGTCVLNVCFPYTSREEITTAIRETVEEYSRPISHKQGRPSPSREERIASTIRSQQQHDTNAKPTYLQPPADDMQSPSSSTTSLSSYSHSDQDHEHDTSSVSTSTTLHHDDNTTSPPPEFTSLDSKEQQDASQQKPIYPSPELITPETLNSHMYTASDPPIDLLIRTSGVSRLSDFMLWQCHEDTQIMFLDVLWPDFDLWSFLPVLWEWQWRARKSQAASGTEDEIVESKQGVKKVSRSKLRAEGVKAHAA